MGKSRLDEVIAPDTTCEPHFADRASLSSGRMALSGSTCHIKGRYQARTPLY